MYVRLFVMDISHDTLLQVLAAEPRRSLLSPHFLPRLLPHMRALGRSTHPSARLRRDRDEVLTPGGDSPRRSPAQPVAAPGRVRGRPGGARPSLRERAQAFRQKSSSSELLGFAAGAVWLVAAVLA